VVSLSFGVLGPLEVWREGAPLRLGAAKQRALLGVFLARRGEVSRDLVIDAYRRPTYSRPIPRSTGCSSAARGTRPRRPLLPPQSTEPGPRRAQHSCSCAISSSFRSTATTLQPRLRSSRDSAPPPPATFTARRRGSRGS